MNIFMENKGLKKQQMISIVVTVFLLLGCILHYLVVSAAENGSTLRYQGDGFYIEATEIIETDETNGLKKVYSQGKYGFDDAEGNHVIPAQYEDAKDFSNGFAAVKLFNEWEGVALWGYIDTKGNKMTDFIYEEAESFSEGFGAVKTGGKWGFVDESGTPVIPAVYEETNYGIPCFSNGMAWVGVIGEDNEKKYGAINTSGEYVIQPLYDKIGDHGFQGDVIAMEKGNYWGLVDRNGNELTDFQTYQNEPVFSEGLAAVYGYSDEKDTPVYSGGGLGTIGGTSGGTGGGSAGGTVSLPARGWGYINQLGELVIDFTYRDAFAFSDGHAFVSTVSSGYIGSQNIANAIIDRQGNLTMLSDDMRIGNYSLKPAFHDGLSYMESAVNGKVGYIDYTGQWVIPPQFESNSPFNQGLCFVSKDGSHYGIINTKGEIVQPFIYGKCWKCPFMYFDNNGLSVVRINSFGIYSNDNQCVIDTDGNVIIPFTEEQKGYYDEEGIYHEPIDYDGYSFQTPTWNNNYTEIVNISNFTDGVIGRKDGKTYLLKVVHDDSKPAVSIDVTDNTIMKQNGVISGQIAYTVMNNSSAVQNANAVIAIYDSNKRLIYIDKEDLSLNRGTNTEQMALSNIPADKAGEYTVKLFLWKSFANMEPLAEAAIVTIR